MTTLLVKFSLYLDDLSDKSQPQGPLFHRWLPDNENDAITLKADESNSAVKVWFERRGHVPNGFIEYDVSRREVDPSIVRRQCKLDGGPLFGKAEIQDVSLEEYTALLENKRDDPSYVSLGKRVACEIIFPPVSRFLNTLRVHYGQYWLREPPAWDSRQISLGGYCSNFNMRWSTDDGVNWSDFCPTEFILHIVAGGGISQKYQDYLEPDDWKELAQHATLNFEPSLAATTLARAHEHSDSKNFRSALIEGVVALELAIHEFLQSRLKGSSSLLKSTQAFRKLPLRSQVVTLAHQVPDRLSVAELEAATRAIDHRNKVVHEGWDPSQSIVETDLCALIRTVSILLSGPKFKFPTLHLGNHLLSPEGT